MMKNKRNVSEYKNGLRGTIRFKPINIVAIIVQVHFPRSRPVGLNDLHSFFFCLSMPLISALIKMLMRRTGQSAPEYSLSL